MNAQHLLEDDLIIKNEVIGEDDYIVATIIKSAYSCAYIIAKANTIVKRVARIQLIVQNTGRIDYTVPRQVFEAVLKEDELYPDEKEPLVGLYVTGVENPLKAGEFWIDNTNVAHYSDMVDTTIKAMELVKGQAETTQTFQIFQKTLVEIGFILAINIDRWVPIKLYKFDGGTYIPIMSIPPRSPN